MPVDDEPIDSTSESEVDHLTQHSEDLDAEQQIFEDDVIVKPGSEASSKSYIGVKIKQQWIKTPKSTAVKTRKENHLIVFLFILNKIYRLDKNFSFDKTEYLLHKRRKK